MPKLVQQASSTAILPSDWPAHLVCVCICVGGSVPAHPSTMGWMTCWANLRPFILRPSVCLDFSTLSSSLATMAATSSAITQTPLSCICYPVSWSATPRSRCALHDTLYIASCSRSHLLYHSIFIRLCLEAALCAAAGCSPLIWTLQKIVAVPLICQEHADTKLRVSCSA